MRVNIRNKDDISVLIDAATREIEFEELTLSGDDLEFMENYPEIAKIHFQECVFDNLDLSYLSGLHLLKEFSIYETHLKNLDFSFLSTTNIGRLDLRNVGPSKIDLSSVSA